MHCVHTKVPMREESVVPRPRGRAPTMCMVVLGLLALVAVWLMDSSLVRKSSGLIALPLILGTILHCLCLFLEEWLFHSHQRYGGSVKQMLQACFNSATVAGLCVVFLLLVAEGTTYTPEQRTLVILTSCLYLLLKILGILGPAPVEISEICESKKMNVAHGLAWSFYVGYLKLVLPELEEQVKKHYMKTREVLSSVRLHILLPLSAAATAKLEEVDRNVLFHQNLPELQLDRAGVRRRVYKHSIYKITDQNEKDYYCVAEYATPLLTLYQMSQESSAGFSAWDRRQQVLLFYTTLSNILENSLECRNRYRLILLDDEQSAEPHYLSQELIKTLQQQEQEIPMDVIRELPRPVAEEGLLRAPVRVQQNGLQEEPPSSVPSLMISGPGTLRSVPVENTDYTNNYPNTRR
ncbi:hypothetical protein NFI96_032740 [Prochilodus magdalenae]|nr:hypothetical protein NFI96_032740 [Prochilodus magdalenae]